jgi:hypothetical protein
MSEFEFHHATETAQGNNLDSMASTKYSPLSTEPPHYETDSESDGEDSPPAPDHVLSEEMQARLNAHFHQPTPSPFSRAALILFFLFICWLAFRMRIGSGPNQVVYADR